MPGDTIQLFAGVMGACTATVASSGAWSCAPTSPLADGTYILVAVQLGASGTPSGTSTMRTLVVDNAGLPAPTFDQPVSPTVENEPTLSGTAEAGATVTVTDATTGAAICSAAASNAGIWSCTPTTPLSVGSHTMIATATDAAGNISPASMQRTIDVISANGLPTVTISAPTAGAQFENTRPQITGTSTPGTTVAVTIDGQTYQAQTATDGTWSLTPLTDLSVGTHTVSAGRYRGPEGRVSPEATTSSEILQDAARSRRLHFGRRAFAGARAACAARAVPGSRLAQGKLTHGRGGVSRAELASARRKLRGGRGDGWDRNHLVGRPRAEPISTSRTFRPAAGGDGYVGVEGARPPIDDDKDGRLDIKLWLDGTNKPLTVIQEDGTNHALVRQRYDGWLSAQFHLNGPLSLSAQLPFLLGQNGDLSFLPPAARGPASFSASIGDIRLTPRVSLLRQESVGVDLAIQGSLELPTGQTDSLSSDDRVNGEFLGAIAHRFYLDGPGSIELLGNVYTRLRPPREILDVKVGSTAGIRAALGYYFGDQACKTSGSAAGLRRARWTELLARRFYLRLRAR